MKLKYLGLLAITLISVTLMNTLPSYGVEENNNVIILCEVGTNPKQSANSFIFIEEKTLLGGDKSANIVPYSSKEYFGIFTFFPLIVPKKETLKKGKTVHWKLFNYSYSAVPQSDANPDWFLITATGDKTAKDTLEKFTFLYSLDSGVLTMRVKRRDAEKANEGYVCGKRKFLLEDFLDRKKQK